jgi:Protein phosphatase 2C
VTDRLYGDPVRVAMATGPGDPDVPNEDFVGATAGLAVVVDGAGIPETETLCRHGVAWYADTLGSTLLSLWARRPTGLPALLAGAIDDVAGRHRHTCDIADPSSPQATVAMVAVREEGVSWLALADAYVVLDGVDAEARVVTDGREVAVRRHVLGPLDRLTPGTEEYERTLAAGIDALRARRNRPGGYWIAKDDPAAAAEAVTGSAALAEVAGVALLSNGASRVVEPYGVLDWPDVLRLLRRDGPDELLGRLRLAERSGRFGLPPDDASVAFVALS